MREAHGRVDIAGRVITLDALHSVMEAEKAIVQKHRTHCMMTLKENACKARKYPEKPRNPYSRIE